MHFPKIVLQLRSDSTISVQALNYFLNAFNFQWSASKQKFVKNAKKLPAQWYLICCRWSQENNVKDDMIIMENLIPKVIKNCHRSHPKFYFAGFCVHRPGLGWRGWGAAGGSCQPHCDHHWHHLFLLIINIIKLINISLILMIIKILKQIINRWKRWLNCTQSHSAWKKGIAKTSLNASPR